MTHDELLEKIRLKFFVNEEGATGSGYKESQLRNAVYAVVELHKPELHQNDNVEGCVQCSSFSYRYVEYPCPTIQIIEKELSNG